MALAEVNIMGMIAMPSRLCFAWNVRFQMDCSMQRLVQGKAE
jgi:hypothetical protein